MLSHLQVLEYLSKSIDITDKSVLVELGVGRTTEFFNAAALKYGCQSYSFDVSSNKISSLQSKFKLVKYQLGDSLVTLKEFADVVLNKGNFILSLVLFDSAPSAMQTFSEFQILERFFSLGSVILIDNATLYGYDKIHKVRSACRKGKILIPYLQAEPHWRVVNYPEWGDSMIYAVLHNEPKFRDNEMEVIS